MLKSKIRTIPDRPKPWISFKDITTLIWDWEWLKEVSKKLFELYKDEELDFVAWIESRWFIFWAILAENLWIWFIPIRKQWKLPADTESISYDLEYWSAVLEIHKDGIKEWQKVVIIDDLIATWWSCLASCKLIEKVWWIIHSIACVIDLPSLWWSEKINNQWYNVFSLVEY